MSAPKTIYTDGHKNLIEGIFEAAHHADKEIHEYRLVDSNEQSKIERIRAEIELTKKRWGTECSNAYDVALEIIDRINNTEELS